jgi:hypothetical protein
MFDKSDFLCKTNPILPHFPPENEDSAKKQTQFKANQTQYKPNFEPTIRGAKPIQTQINPTPSEAQVLSEVEGFFSYLMYYSTFHISGLFILIYNSRILNWIKSWHCLKIVKNCLITVSILSLRGLLSKREELLSCRLTVVVFSKAQSQPALPFRPPPY